MTRVLRFHITSKHPDWVVACEQSVECRRLFNSLNAVAREASAYRHDSQADTHISAELGLLDFVRAKPPLANTYGYEPIRKPIEAAQGINLPQKVAQRVGIAVANAWKSFYVLRKNGRTANPPRFKRMYGTVEYTKQALSAKDIRKGVIRPTGWKTGVKLPTHVTGWQIQAARLVHSHDRVFVLEVVYNETPVRVPRKRVAGLSAGVDLGIDSLATVAFSDTSIRPLRVDGRWLKSVNRFYNKKGAQYRSRLDREARNLQIKHGVERISIPSQALDTLWKKRHRKVNHYLHSASRAVVSAVLDAGVETVVIGWNDGFKSGSRMGRRNNQNFVSIPHARFRDMLIYKLQETGVNVLIQEESYTSKASFLDGDDIPVYNKAESKKPVFSGKRITRGQYRASCGTVVHADVNGSLNILRKSNQPMRLDKGVIVTPQRLQFSY